MSDPRQRELAKQNRLLVRQEALAAAELAKLIRRMATSVADRFSLGNPDAALTAIDDAKPEIAAILQRRMVQTALIFGERTLHRVESLTAAKSYYPGLPIGSGPVRGGAEDFVHRPDYGLAWDVKDARAIFERTIRQWIALHALERAGSIAKTLRDAVRGVLQEAIDAGAGEAGAVRMIRNTIGGRLSATNAARIARTEMHTASTIGADEAARSTGLDMVKEWASAEDSRTRPSHARADGQEVGLDEPFEVGGVRMMMPGDPSAPAREVINCRCAIIHHPMIGGNVIRGDGLPSPPRRVAPAPAAAPEFDRKREYEAARAYVLEKGRRQGVEHLIAYDVATGRKFAPMRGGRSHCALSQDMVATLDDPAARVEYHHNHPSSSSLSPTDVRFLTSRGVEAIIAHGHDGSEYLARRGSLTITREIIDGAYKAAYEFLNPYFQSRSITADDASYLNAHIAWLSLHRAGYMTYEAKLAGGLAGAVERHGAIIDRFLGAER